VAKAYCEDWSIGETVEGIMVNYVRAAATAKRLIEANGRYVTLFRKDKTAADTSKPWRGPIGSSDEEVGTVKAVFYPIEEYDEKEGLVRRAEEKVMIAHDSLPIPEDLEDIDHMVDNGKIYKVITASPLGPGSVRVAYEFVVKR
jgi:hypothetical protein